MRLDIKEEQEYRIALSEVDDILTFSDETIISRIPKSFVQFVRENKDKSYITNINPYLALEEQNIHEKTKALMSLIYRSYLATEEEKKAFVEKDREEFEKIEALKAEKYNPDNIFKNNNIKPEPVKPEVSIAVIEEKNIFKKIIAKIKNIFSV